MIAAAIVIFFPADLELFWFGVKWILVIRHCRQNLAQRRSNFKKFMIFEPQAAQNVPRTAPPVPE